MTLNPINTGAAITILMIKAFLRPALISDFIFFFMPIVVLVEFYRDLLQIVVEQGQGAVHSLCTVVSIGFFTSEYQTDFGQYTFRMKRVI